MGMRSACCQCQTGFSQRLPGSWFTAALSFCCLSFYTCLQPSSSRALLKKMRFLCAGKGLAQLAAAPALPLSHIRQQQVQPRQHRGGRV